MEIEWGTGKVGRREAVTNREGALCGIAIYPSITESAISSIVSFIFFVILNLFIFIFYQYIHVSEI